MIVDKNPVEIICELISDESRITKEEREAMVDILYHSDEDFLAHYGVRGMRKGIRRWTNEDGTLTEAGKEHYGILPHKKAIRDLDEVSSLSGYNRKLHYDVSNAITDRESKNKKVPNRYLKEYGETMKDFKYLEKLADDIIKYSDNINTYDAIRSYYLRGKAELRKN